jgi:hypothetical protein
VEIWTVAAGVAAVRVKLADSGSTRESAAEEKVVTWTMGGAGGRRLRMSAASLMVGA